MMKGPCVERLNQSSLNQFHEMRVLVGQENEILTPTLQETKSKEGIKGILKKNTVKKAKTLKGSSMFSMFREINKIKLVKMAIKKFRKGLANSFFGKLLKIHFQIIGDPVNVQDGFDKFSAKKSFTFWKKCLFQSWLPVIDQNSKGKLLWDLLILFLICSNLVYVSIQITFQPQFSASADNKYKLLTIFCFFLDMLLKLKTSFYSHGVAVTDRKLIYMNYIKGDFFMDLISLLGIVIHVALEGFPIFTWFIMAVFIRVKSIWKIVRDFENLIDVGDLYELTVVMLKLLSVAHIYACAWHYIGYYSDYSDNWLNTKGIHDSSWEVRYLYSIYWSLTTMVTVGYGDITPQNTVETFFSVFTILSGSMMFGYCLNRIGCLLTRIDENDKELKQNIKIMDHYMKSHNISADLKARAINYLEFNLQFERRNMEKEQILLDKLPESLKQAVVFESNKKSLFQFQILKANFNEEILNRLSAKVRPAQYAPKEIIYSKDDFEINNPSLFLLVEGEVEVCFNQRILYTIQQNHSFGEFEFFSNNPYQETVISSTFTTVYKIPRKDFLSLLKGFPQEYENFCWIRDRLTLYSDFSFLHFECFSCGLNTHTLNNCPLIKTYYRKDLVMRRLLYSRPQTRQPFVRQKTTNYRRASKNKKMLTRSAIKIRFNGSIMQTFENFQSSTVKEVFSDESQQISNRKTFQSLSLQSLRDLRPDSPIEKTVKSADDFLESHSMNERFLNNELDMKKIHLKPISRDRPKERRESSFEEMKGEDIFRSKRPLSKILRNTFSNLDEAFDEEINLFRDPFLNKPNPIHGRGGRKRTTLLEFKGKKGSKSSSLKKLHTMNSKPLSISTEDNMLLSNEIRRKKRSDSRLSSSSKTKGKTSKNQFYDYDFEKICDFKNYFSHGNYSNLEQKMRKSVSPLRAISSARSSVWSRRRQVVRAKLEFKV